MSQETGSSPRNVLFRVHDGFGNEHVDGPRGVFFPLSLPPSGERGVMLKMLNGLNGRGVILLLCLAQSACSDDPDSEQVVDGSGDATSDGSGDATGDTATEGSGDTTADGSGDTSDAALALRVSPNPLLLRVGESPQLTISVVGADGIARQAAEGDFTVTLSDDLFDQAGAALRTGKGELTVAAAGREARIPVIIGPDLFALGGSTDSIHELFEGSGQVDAGEAAGNLPTRARRIGDELFVVASGDVFGDTTPTSLRKLSLATGTWTPAPVTLDGNGGYDLVGRDGATLWLVGHNNTLSILRKSDLTIESTLDFAAAFPNRAIALESGGTGLVDQGLLVVADPGLRPDYSYDAGALFLLDNALGLPVDALPETAEFDPLLLDDACRNPIWIDRFENELLVGCAGDYAENVAGIAFVDRFALLPTGFVALGAAASSFALDAATGLVVAGDAYGANAWVLQAATREVIRGADAAPWLAPVRAADFDFTQVFVDSRSRAWAGTYGSAELFALPLDAPAAGPLAPSAQLIRDGLSIGIAGFVDAGIWLPPAWASADHLTAVAYEADRTARDVTALISGAPAGGTALVPNADTSTLATLADGGELLLDLGGIVLHDGPGPDFAVYENPMMTVSSRAQRAIDPARVEVSADGVTFVPLAGAPDPASLPLGFPTDARAFGRNTVGREPVFANAENDLAPGSAEAGGDLLDLAGCGLSEVRFVRILDYPGDNRGADIDALAWIHWSEE